MPVSLTNLLIIAGALFAALGVTIVVMRIVRWRRDVALRTHEIPVLVMPIAGTAVPPRPHLAREVYAPPSTVRRIAVREPEEPRSEILDEVDVTFEADEPYLEATTQPPRLALDPTDTPGTSGAPHAGRVRYYSAEDGTLEFLPGRLEILAGGDVGQEIHFTREVGQDDATITFGRSEGTPLRHVQLVDPTVSRQHAELSYTGGRWHLTNRSQTNPVTLNGVSLTTTLAMTLRDGDRIEMGAVVFIFHER
jgi:hypothetical protein